MADDSAESHGRGIVLKFPDPSALKNVDYDKSKLDPFAVQFQDALKNAMGVTGLCHALAYVAQPANIILQQGYQDIMTGAIAPEGLAAKLQTEVLKYVQARE